MKKAIFLFIILFSPFMIVSATNKNSNTWSGVSLTTCTGLQDRSVSTDGDVYFSHCMEVDCNSGSYGNTYYYDKNSYVSCSNGNNDPYRVIYNNTACSKLKGRCTSKMYCSMIMYYDCSRTSSGNSFYTEPITEAPTEAPTEKQTEKPTVKQTQKPTVKPTIKTEAPTEPIIVDTKLASLSLSNVSINFSSDVYSYDITVPSTVDHIEVNPVPVDSNNKVEIEGNTGIVDGSVISITVTANNGSSSLYLISIKKEDKQLSNNSKLKNINVEKYSIGTFNSKITNYSVLIDRGVSSLDISVETEDENATYVIEGNTNLANGSEIIIRVTAEDGTSVNIYTINVTVKKKSNIIKILFTIILILAILAGVYYLYKKFVAGKSGGDYEYE